ncbi:hypothetical protein QV08_09800, partial [Gallibacterium salpingitidis]|uniref:hypothetical protein n=1 Tax=Gallibacterium salpingitidis TaxID=505341 RepID=UPI00080485AD
MSIIYQSVSQLLISAKSSRQRRSKQFFKLSILAAILQSTLLFTNSVYAKDYPNGISNNDGDNVVDVDENISTPWIWISPTGTGKTISVIAKDQIDITSVYGVLSEYQGNDERSIFVKSKEQGINLERIASNLSATTIQLQAQKSIVLDKSNTDTIAENGYFFSIDSEKKSQILLSSEESNSIKIGDALQFPNPTKNVGGVIGIYNLSGANTKLTAKENSISIYAPNAKNRWLIYADDTAATSQGSVVLETKEGGNNTLILETTTTNQADGFHNGISAQNNAQVLLSAETGINSIKIGDANQFTNPTGNVAGVFGIYNYSGANTKLTAKENSIFIYAPNAKTRYLVFANSASETGGPSVLLDAKDGGNNLLTLETTATNQKGGIHEGVYAANNTQVLLSAKAGINSIKIGDSQQVGDLEDLNNQVVEVNGVRNVLGASTKLTAKSNQISIYAPNAKNRYLINADSKAKIGELSVVLDAKDGGNNLLTLETTATNQKGGIHEGVYAANNTQVLLSAKAGINSIKIGDSQQVGDLEDLNNQVVEVNGVRNVLGASTKLTAKSNQISIYASNAKDRYLINADSKAENSEQSVILEATEGGNNLLTLETTATNQTDGSHYGVLAQNKAQVLLSAETGINSIKIGDENQFANPTEDVKQVYGIYNGSGASTQLIAQSNDISIYAPNAKDQYLIYGNGKLDNGKESVLLQATSGDNHLTLSSDLLNEKSYGLVQGYNNNQINLTATGNNLIEYNGKLTGAIPTNQTELDNNQSFIRGIISWVDSDVKLEAQNNVIRIQGSGNGLGVGYQELVNGNWYTYQTEGLLVTNESITGSNPKDISRMTLVATNGSNVVDINLRSHGETYGVVAQHKGEMTLSATDANWIRVLSPERDTPLMNLNTGMKIYRMGLYSSVDSVMALQAASNYIEIGGNPVMQRGIAVNANSMAELVAEQSNNVVAVRNAVLSSYGVSVAKSILIPSETEAKTKLNLTALQGTNFIQMQGDEADLAIVEQSAVLKNTGNYQNKVGTIGIYAIDKGSAITLNAKQNVIKHNVPTESPFSNINIYAADEAQVKLIGTESNTLTGAKIAIQSLNKANVTIDGQMTIDSSLWAADARNAGQIALNYEKDSVIKGSMIAIGGDIQVKSKGSTLHLTGDEYAYDNGNITLQLTPGSLAVGRMDNFVAYDNAQHKVLFGLTPVASNAGQIYLNLAKNSLWQMTGQSWISELRGEGAVDVSPI